MGNKIMELFKTIGDSLGKDMNGVFILTIVLFVLCLIISVVLIYYSDEFKTNQSINMLNNYLTQKQYVEEENLVEFNKLMKKVPKPIREQWQKYMINRGESPSKYINCKNCVEDILKNGMFTNIVSSYYLYATFFIASLLVLIAIPQAESQTVLGTCIWIATSPCLLFLTLSLFTNFVLRILYNSIINDMRYNISYLESALDRAVVKMPEVVDYEILFTKKEIRANIPALQEYYIQKAQYEEQELMQAKNREVEHEDYNFEDLGIDGSIVMERAMKESEFYMGNRRRLMQEIDQISAEKSSVEKEFNDKYRSAQRKITEIKENLNRLKERLENTTQKIVINDIKKQQADEIKKQQVVEKEVEEEEQKYNRNMERIEKEIATRKEEIENGKNYVEKTLIQEFNNYAEKVRKSLKENVIGTVESDMNDMVNDIQNLKDQLKSKDLVIKENGQIINEKSLIIEDMTNKLKAKENELKKIYAGGNVIEKEIIKEVVKEVYIDAATGNVVPKPNTMPQNANTVRKK